MIKRVLLLGVGAAAGWLGHTAYSKGRDAAALKAEETLRNTLNPENIGRNAGQAAATALAASARSFAYQLREEVPAWKTVPSTLAGAAPRATAGDSPAAGHETIPGTATSAPAASGTAGRSTRPDSRKQS
ncbi:MAG: hypothetical protein MOP51_337 [Citricoccus sp.]|nr:hypothetical protein [Citricoccus sp. WCRC_4]